MSAQEGINEDGRYSVDSLPDSVPAVSPRSVSSVVSLRELQHPVSKKAIREALDAQRFVRANNFPKAIAKLESAVRIDPDYRDAHCDLGVLYARTGRPDDALSEFHKALDIGPPVAPIYADLALISAALRQFSEAKQYAAKGLQLDPDSKGARWVLERLKAR